MILLVNDSYFSYLIAKPIFEEIPHEVNAIVFSRRIKGSSSRIRDVYGKSYVRYFAYRAFIELANKWNALRGAKSVASLAKARGIKCLYSGNINLSSDLASTLTGDLAVAINFDQVIKPGIIERFNKGIVNLHASKLPRDRGISPVLWAFARGDESIWASIYSMDGGLDTGSLYKQFEVPLQQHDTAFSAYERVCRAGGEQLLGVIKSLLGAGMPSHEQVQDNASEYWSWPDRTHRAMMKASGRRFVTAKQCIALLRS